MLPPLRIRTTPYCRDAPEIKHVGLFGPLHQRRLSQLGGFDDVLFTDGRSAISEGATWNIGFFDGARLLWPDARVLPGVTMKLLQQNHTGAQSTEPISTDWLPRMQAAFATSAGIGIRPIAAIDDVEFDADHAVFGVLRKEYATVPPERL
jgi:branched-subunit amino acid aminotransferase/4-amino-4-deoxychorismate lyase